MNRSVRRRLGVLIFGFVLIAAACGDDDDRAVTTVVPTTAATTTQAPPEPIVIGVVAGLTGRGASFSVPWEMGLQLAIQQFEDLGGIDGRPVTVIIEDSESRPEGALAAATKLVTVDNVDVLLLGVPSSEIGVVAEFAADEGIPVVNAGASTPAIRDFAGTVISTLALDDAVAAGLADWVYDQGFRRAAFVVGNEPYGLGVLASVGARFEAIGGEVVVEAAVELGQADYRAEMQRVHDADPEVVFNGTFADDAKLQFRQLSEIGSAAPWYAMYPTVIAVNDFEPMFGKVFGLEHGWQGDEAWVSAFVDLHGEDPTTPWPALGYDSLWLAALGVAGAADDSAPALAESLLAAATTYSGPSGAFDFDESLTRANQVFVRLALQDGAFVEVE